MSAVFTLATVIGLSIRCAIVQQGHAGHAGYGATAPANAGASIKAFQAANAAMHKDMDIAFTGDADVDFVRAMIPHHQGAVAMANVVLQDGKDPPNPATRQRNRRRAGQGNHRHAVVVRQQEEVLSAPRGIAPGVSASASRRPGPGCGMTADTVAPTWTSHDHRSRLA